MTRINSSHKSSPVVTVCSSDHMNHGSDLMSLTGYDGAGFFSCFSCQLSISNKELSNDLSYAGHPTGCMIELTASGLEQLQPY